MCRCRIMGVGFRWRRRATAFAAQIWLGNGMGGYATLTGTSQSAPHVAGVAALVLSVNSSLTNAQVRDIIQNTADDKGTAGFDPYYGYGRVNAYRAVQMAGQVLPASTATPTSAPTQQPTTAPTNTPLPMATPTNTPAPTAMPTNTPAPTNTPLPTATATNTSMPTNTPVPTVMPTATPTQVAAQTTNVGDLDKKTVKLGKDWQATAKIYVENANHSPLANATVSGAWSGGYSSSASCVTNSSGWCSVVTGRVWRNYASVDFTVNAVSYSSYIYSGSANHDPDGDSDGTRIVIPKP